MSEEDLKTHRISLVVGGSIRDVGPLEKVESIATHHAVRPLTKTPTPPHSEIPRG